MKIPENEQENFIHVYWQMLRALEEDGNHNDPWIKNLVEGGYNVLNRAGITKGRPTWEK